MPCFKGLARIIKSLNCKGKFKSSCCQIDVEMEQHGKLTPAQSKTKMEVLNKLDDENNNANK